MIGKSLSQSLSPHSLIRSLFLQGFKTELWRPEFSLLQVPRLTTNSLHFGVFGVFSNESI